MSTITPVAAAYSSLDLRPISRGEYKGTHMLEADSSALAGAAPGLDIPDGEPSGTGS